MKQNPLRETGPGISEECIERRHRALGVHESPSRRGQQRGDSESRGDMAAPGETWPTLHCGKGDG